MKLEFKPQLKPLDRAQFPALPAAKTKLSQADLSGVISHPRKKNASPDSLKVGITQQERLEEQARQLVAQTFFGTMLKQMRQSPFRSDLFEGGRGGQAFSELYDQKLIEHMSRGAGNGLVHSIVKSLSRAKRPSGTSVSQSDQPHAALNAQDALAAYQKQAGKPGSNERSRVAPQSKTPNVRTHVAPAGRS